MGLPSDGEAICVFLKNAIFDKPFSTVHLMKDYLETLDPIAAYTALIKNIP